MIRENFNTNWKVSQNSGSLAMPNPNAPAALAVDLPYDAMIMTRRSPGNTTAGGSAFFTPENLAYTKNFFVPVDDQGKVCFLEFEGVYMNATVWVNGAFAGKCPYGYSNFYVQINDFLKYGQDNEINVYVKNVAQTNSRWYSGTGIYRDVKLMMGHPLHIKVDGVRISTPEIEKDLAVVEVATDVEHLGIGHKGGYVRTVLKAQDGQVVAQGRTKFNITSHESITVRQRFYIKNPQLWDTGNPALYSCGSSIIVDDQVMDEDNNNFGVRKLQLDPVNGLRINGKSVKLKGGCIHHDNGVIGAATFEDAEERRARLLKSAGYNAIRSAHNPLSKAMLEACDKVGLFVMDEFTDVWTQTKGDFDYGFHFAEWWEKDIEAMVRKDFNHPCVILYSIGNEIPEVGSEIGAVWGRKIAEKVRSIDSSRYVTNGINVMLGIKDYMGEILASIGGDDPMSRSGEINQAMTDMRQKMRQILAHPIVDKVLEESCGILDVTGYNYAADRYEKDHASFPDRVFVGTETGPSALDVNWDLVMNQDYVIGDFSWTAWDYLGETGIGHIAYDDDRNAAFYGAYPWIAAYCADFDLTGGRRPISYWREIIWGGRNHVPYIAVQRPERYGQKVYPGMWSWTDTISSWTWPGYEGKGVVVEVYSDAEEVELFINGRSQGRKAVGDEFKKFYCKWDTLYASGEIEAVAYISGAEAGRYSLKTAGKSYLKVTKECGSLRAGTNDLCYVNIELADQYGVLNTSDQAKVTLQIEGPATIQGCGSANPRMEENYFDLTHETFFGRMLAVVRAGTESGTARLLVSAEGMNSVVLEIPVIAAI